MAVAAQRTNDDGYNTCDYINGSFLFNASVFHVILNYDIIFITNMLYYV